MYLDFKNYSRYRIGVLRRMCEFMFDSFNVLRCIVMYRCYMKDKIYTLFLCAVWCFSVVFIGVIGVVYGN